MFFNILANIRVSSNVKGDEGRIVGTQPCGCAPNTVTAPATRERSPNSPPRSPTYAPGSKPSQTESANKKSDSAAADPADPKPSLIRPFTGRARQRLRRDGQRLLRGRADLRARTRPVAQRRRTRTRDAVVGVLVQRRPHYHSHCHDVRPTSSKQRFMAQLTASTGVGNQ